MPLYSVTVETPHYKELIVNAPDHRKARLVLSAFPPDDVTVVDAYEPNLGSERIVGPVKRIRTQPTGP